MPRYLKCKGFALITVLIFLQLFSLLGVLSMMNAILQLKTAHHAWRSGKVGVLSNERMKIIEAQVLNDLYACQIAVMSSDKIVKMPARWWKDKACSDEHAGIHADYVIENLGFDPCSVSPKPVTFYRLTMRSFSVTDRNTKFYFQSTIAIPSNAHVRCDEVIHQVKVGRQMWRQLRIM